MWDAQLLLLTSTGKSGRMCQICFPFLCFCMNEFFPHRHSRAFTKKQKQTSFVWCSLATDWRASTCHTSWLPSRWYVKRHFESLHIQPICCPQDVLFSNHQEVSILLCRGGNEIEEIPAFCLPGYSQWVKQAGVRLLDSPKTFSKRVEVMLELLHS